MTTFEHTFTWPDSSALKVFATGTFDSWKSTLKLEKGANGVFTAKYQLPVGKKTLYKYVVDGQWVLSQAEPTMADHSGNVNNFVQAPEVTEAAAEATPAATTVVTPAGETEVVETAPVPVAVDEDAEKPVVELFESNGHLAAIGSGILGAAGIAAAALISVDPSTFTSASPPVSPLKSTSESLPLVADATTSAVDSTPAPVVETPKVEEVKSVETAPAPAVAEEKPAEVDSKISEVPVIGAVVVGATALLGGAAALGHQALASVGSIGGSDAAEDTSAKVATKAGETAVGGIKKAEETIPASMSGEFGSSTAKALGLEKEFAATSSNNVVAPVIPAPSVTGPTIANPTIATAVTPAAAVGQEQLKPIVPLLPLNEDLVNNKVDTQAIPTPVVPALESALPATVVTPTPTASAAVVDTPVTNETAPAIPVKDGLPPVAAAAVVSTPTAPSTPTPLEKKAHKPLEKINGGGADDGASTRTKKSSFMSKMKKAFGGGSKKDKKSAAAVVPAVPAIPAGKADVQSDDR